MGWMSACLMQLTNIFNTFCKNGGIQQTFFKIIYHYLNIIHIIVKNDHFHDFFI